MTKHLGAALRRIVPAALLACGGLAHADGDWPYGGHDLRNTRHQADEHRIDVTNVAALTPKWVFATAADVPVNPAVEDDYLYFPDIAGFLYKVDRKGNLIWKTTVSSYTGNPGDYARATPAIVGDLLILGNQAGKLLGPKMGQANPAPAKVFAVDKMTGKLAWVTQVDDTPLSVVTHSPIVVKGLAIVGVASNEELVAGFVPKAYWQWQFRGSVSALDVKTGAVKWKTYTVPPGYYGGSVWGSTGSADLRRNQVYMASGDNFWAPQSVYDCMNAGGKASACLSPDDHFDSVMALDIDTGKINWAQRGIPYDVWNVGCGLFVPGFTIPPNDNCPNPKGPDWDFAQGPILMSRGGDDDHGDHGDEGRGNDDIVGAGQKSGMFWAFRAKDGKLVWNTQVGPGGLTGGLQWGSAYDGERIYVAVSNAGPILGNGQDAQPWTLKDGTTTTSGGWAALNPRNGQILWTTKDPQGNRSEAPVSVANGVVYGCNLNYNPAAATYFAMDAKTGAIKWSYVSGAPCVAGASISNGMVFWGTGTGRGTGKAVYGLSLP
jgi:polyvinyl alcohol dehydrogenase (cytochrome)